MSFLERLNHDLTVPSGTPSSGDLGSRHAEAIVEEKRTSLIAGKRAHDLGDLLCESGISATLGSRASSVSVGTSARR